MSKRNLHGEKSIGEILQAIQDTMNKGPSTSKVQEEEELHLTEILHTTNISENPSEEGSDKDSLLSNYSSNQTQSILHDFLETASTLGHHQKVMDEPKRPSSSEIDAWITELIKPQLSTWLDKNLSVIVKQVVSEEIKKLVANIQNNKTF